MKLLTPAFHLASTNSHTADLWSSAYQVIAQANACIAGLATSKAISAGLIKQYTSEAEFMRAFSYFYLVNLYGDVPLVLNTNYQKESTIARTPASQVYLQIISDLQNAVNDLPTSYASGQHVRATKWAATALLARVNLYLKNWAIAQTLATSVINNSGTSLEPDLNNVFLIGSSEAIWQVQPPTYYKNAIDFDVMFNYSYGYYITNSLFNAFEPGDQRKSAWLDSTVNSGQPTVYYPYKYKADAYSGNSTEYTVMLRLAEQYLIRAEALANQNNIPAAIADLNTIRNRAGLPNLSTSLTAVQFAAAIEHERRIELFAEWGHRWLDLKRLPSVTVPGNSRADDVLGVLKAPNWQPSDQLYPIPYQDTKLNPNLTQNPGY
jgi:hypothetical protein